MRFTFFSVFLVLFPAGLLPADDALPVCFHIESDSDGDGFGYENSVTCVVDETTRSITEPNVCIDDNADGYGWNGIETCSVDVVPNPGCEDTPPVGDGWGWNGVGSCRVYPQESKPVSELEVIKSKLVDVVGRDRNVAAFYCPDSDETVYLHIYGVLEWFIGSNLESVGVWSSGMYDKDGLVSTTLYKPVVWFYNSDHRVSFRLEDRGLTFGNATRCFWFADGQIQ